MSLDSIDAPELALTPGRNLADGAGDPPKPPPKPFRNPTTLVKKRRPVIQACHECRKRKLKCDGGRPTCHLCKSKGRECGYYGVAGTRRAAGIESRMNALEAKVRLMGEASNQDTPAASLHGEQPVSHAPMNASQPAVEVSFPPAFPSSAIIASAVDAFFSCSGKLFHVYTREQVDAYYQAVVRQGFLRTPSDGQQRVATSCLCAVAAVGCQYSLDTLDKSVETGFYDLTRHFFETVIELRPFDAVKVAVLLAMYNIMNKCTVALGYVEIGLSMSRRLRLDDKTHHSPSMSAADWTDCRKAWRTLVFFSSWLASTLGYISGNDVLSHLMPLSEMDIDGSRELSDIVQTQMAKIALLKAKILRFHLTFKDLTIPAIQSISNDLQAWYDQLPAELHLLTLRDGGRSYDAQVRRTIYHVHLLYLGAMILLHRRLSYQVLHAQAAREVDILLPNPLLEAAHENVEQGLLAAKQSAKIIKLLLDEDGVYKRCWLVIFQSYVSGIIVLHSAAQKQMFRMDRQHWAEELSCARRCLYALRFCGSADPVAANLLNKLEPVYCKLAMSDDQSRNKTGKDDTENHRADMDRADVGGDGDGAGDAVIESPSSVVLDEGEGDARGNPVGESTGTRYLLSTPPDAPTGLVTTSRFLVEMLCRPFRDPETIAGAKADVQLSMEADPSRAEHVQMIERLQVDYEESHPFSWDVGTLRPTTTDIINDDAAQEMDASALSTSQSLDSNAPHGWQ